MLTGGRFTAMLNGMKGLPLTHAGRAMDGESLPAGGSGSPAVTRTAQYGGRMTYPRIWAPRRRHPGDVLRVLLGSLVVVLTGAFARPGRLSRVEIDLFRLLNHLPQAFDTALIAVMQLGTLAAVPLVAAVALLARRLRLAGDLASAGIAAWLLAEVVEGVVDRGRPVTLLQEVVARTSETGSGFPSGHVAVAAALATAAGPYLPRPARRVAWCGVGLVAVAGVYIGAHLPLDVVGGAGLGWAVAAGIHLLLGTATGVPSPSVVVEGLRTVGIEVAGLSFAGLDARASTPFFIRSTTSAELFVKVVGREQRDADLLFRAWRYAVLRHVEDEIPFATPKQKVEHEAYLMLLAKQAGLHVPGIVTAASAPGGNALLVQHRIDGRSMDRLGADEVDDRLLAALWSQVDLLRAAHIAHRDLRLANILVDRDGTPWLIDFGGAEASASQHRQAQDVAELLVSLAELVGSERAVTSATSVLGPGVVGAAVPLLQPLALSAATRAGLKGRTGLLDELRARAASAADIQVPQLASLVRIRPRTALLVLVGGFAVHLLLPQVGDLGQTLDALGHPRPGWLAAAMIMAVAGFPAAAVSLLGAIDSKLALTRTTAVQVASSFANWITPGGVGGFGLNVRYLERSGFEPSAAVAAVAVSTLAGGLVHVAGLAVVLALLGPTGIDDAKIPNGWPALVVVLAVLVAVGLLRWLPLGRRRVLRPVLRAGHQLAAALRRPSKAAKLLGGSIGATALSVLSLWASLEAFGVHPSLVWVAAVYLGGVVVAAASPTPGGLGAIEAALVAGLTAIGIPPGPAIAGVIAFRLLTFWLPILPAWLTFRALRTRSVI